MKKVKQQDLTSFMKKEIGNSLYKNKKKGD